MTKYTLYAYPSPKHPELEKRIEYGLLLPEAWKLRDILLASGYTDINIKEPKQDNLKAARIESKRKKLLEMLADGASIKGSEVHYRGTVYMGYGEAIEAFRRQNRELCRKVGDEIKQRN